MKTYLKVVFILGFFLVSSMLSAQKTGEVQGFISDAATGEPIGYASVALIGTSSGTISDDNGLYSLKHIQPGTHQIRVTFIGYSEIEESVEVQSGQVSTIDIELVFTSIQGEEVTITAMARGQAKAINTQIAARNIKNVISEQKIRELPDANAAEALARLPGVSVSRSGGEAVAIKVRGVSANTIFVNGMRMAGGLGSISSSMIGSIELSKAFMPDQDADVLGGNVEFKMREAQPGFKKDIWVRTGYNGFTKSFKMQDVSALLSNRFLDDKLGVMLSLSYDRKDRGRDVVSAQYKDIGSSTTGSEDIKPVQIKGVTLDHSQNMNNRYGVTLYTDYRLKNGKLFYQAFLSQLNSENYNLSNSYGDLNTPYLEYESTYHQGSERNFLQGLGGEHTLLGAKIEWGISMSTHKQEIPYQLGYRAQNYEGVSGTIEIDSTTTLNELIDFGTHDIALTNAELVSISDQKSYSDEVASRLDVEVPFQLGSKIGGYLKFGGKYRNMSRGFDRNERFAGFRNSSYDKLGLVAVERLPDYDWTFIPNGWLGHEAFASEPHVHDFSMLGTQTYFYPDFDKVDYVIGVLDDLILPRLSGDVNDYTNSEQYYAGYIMTGIDIGKIITFTPGVRYERYDYSTTAKWAQRVIGYGPYETQGVIRDTTAGHFNAQFFPMIHLKIKPLKWFDIRLAATKTATRPAFNQMSPRYYRPESFDLFTGDIYLKPQINYNYDIYFSFYSRKSGLFTVGAFYKKLTDQVLDYRVTIIDPEEYGLPPAYQNKNYSYPQNNRWPGYVRGVEVDWQTHFSFLPKPLNGIVLNMNMTYMQSETKYPFYSFETITIPDPPFRMAVGEHNYRLNTVIGMPDFIGNVALGYELRGFSGRISAYYQSSTITAAQSSNKTLDMDKDALMRLDMQLSQKFKKVPGLMIYLNVNNITNNPDRNVLTYYHDRIVREERYGVSGDLGLRYKF